MRALLKQALDALDALCASDYRFGEELMDAIEAELAKPEQEPVAWLSYHEPEPLYAAPVDCLCNRQMGYLGTASGEYVEQTKSITDAAAHCLAPHQYEHIKAIADDEPAAIERMDKFMAGSVNCNRHPGAPHGFDRSGSHSAGRYMCVCESWSSGDAS